MCDLVVTGAVPRHETIAKTRAKPANLFMSASTKDREKVRQIFRFLQELHQVKSPPLVDMGLYEWKMSYEALPRFASVQRGEAIFTTIPAALGKKKGGGGGG